MHIGTRRAIGGSTSLSDRLNQLRVTGRRTPALGAAFRFNPLLVAAFAERRHWPGRDAARDPPFPDGWPHIRREGVFQAGFRVHQRVSFLLDCQRSVVHDRASLGNVVSEVLTAFRQPCLVEGFVPGRELNVALFGFPTARVLPLSEIDFSLLPEGEPKIVSYAAKWHEGSVADHGTRPVLHPHLAPAIAARVRRVAVEAFRALGMRDYGRVDIRLSEAGTPYVVDVNPNCDLSPHAGMARAAAAVGIDYASLAKLLVRYALRRRRVAVTAAVVQTVARKG